MSKASPIIVKHKGDLKKTEQFFKRNRRQRLIAVLNQLGQRGVDALSAATPVRTGKTAASWSYEVIESENRIALSWSNSNTTKDGDNIVVLLVRGHGTRDGRYVRGNDFVTPAIEPIFKEIADEAWAEVRK